MQPRTLILEGSGRRIETFTEHFSRMSSAVESETGSVF